MTSSFWDENLKSPTRKVNTHSTLSNLTRIWVFQLGGQTQVNIRQFNIERSGKDKQSGCTQKEIKYRILKKALICWFQNVKISHYYKSEQFLRFFYFGLLNICRMPSSEDKPASFISKLCNILRCKENAKIIYWDAELKGVRIVNQKKLEEVILPRYYRHNRFSSFVRQLNMYDFHKVHLHDHKSIFLHNEFDPKKKDQIHLIRRKVTFDSKSGSEKDPSRREENTSQKQNLSEYGAFFKSSKNYLIKQSIPVFSELGCNKRITAQQALEELISKLYEFKDQQSEFEQKVKEFKKEKRYRSHLKTESFVNELYTRMNIAWEQERDDLSDLSIENELVYKTRRSLAPKSLKFVESGPLYSRRQTIGNFLNM